MVLEGQEKEAVIKVRVNQSIFRDRLIKRYGKCCLCNLQNPKMLIASHIKPWSESEPEEKLNPDNGLLLCPNHDRLFDKGLVTFNEDGRILISNQLEEVDRIFSNVRNDMSISVLKENRAFLKYHRERVFKP